MADLVLRDDDGTLHCSSCRAPIQLQDKVIGLQQGRTFDVFSCPLCIKLYWLPPNSGGERNKVLSCRAVIDG
jgi:hypothetical protein